MTQERICKSNENLICNSDAKPFANVSEGSGLEDFCKGNLSCGDILKKERQKLLLHSCCGPCSTACIERLLGDWDITVFYYNPNITDKEEYEFRKSEQIRFINDYSQKNLLGERINFVEGDYDTDSFFEVAKGYENEPEGGARCEKCFRLRLEGTAKMAKQLGIFTFGTTLTVSPYKNYDIITMIGTEIALKNKLNWLDRNFKKQAGYQRSIELSKEYGLYRQHFCGCEFSKQD